MTARSAFIQILYKRGLQLIIANIFCLILIQKEHYKLRKFGIRVSYHERAVR
jgi:hypothetical protein